jgi:hypothetical protein
MRLRSTTVLLTVALAVAGCARSDAGAPNELTVVPLDGAVTVVSDDDRTVLEETTTVEAGSRVLTGDRGRAEIDLGSGGSLELAPQAEVSLPTDGGSQIVGGSVLVRAPASGMTVRAGQTDLDASQSVFRVDQGLSLILAVYRGAVDVLGAGVEPVPALRQATVVGGEILSEVRPLQVRPDDPWDGELLGPAIELGIRLLTLERGLTRQIPRGGGPQAVADALAQSLPRPLVNRAFRAFDAAAATVAAVLARQASRVAGMSLNRALSVIADLYGDGAHLIVVVAQLQLAQVQSELLRDLARLTGLISRAVAPEPSPSLSSTDGSSPGSPSGSGSGGGTPSGSGGTQNGGSGSQSGGGAGDDETDPPPEDDGGEGGGDDGGAQSCEGQVDCFVEDLIGGPPDQV